ncbi:MAG TPA: hypothetical protein EYP07_03225 [Kiloniellaceae bacterium]|nr:hypothetical protein [Kiloniellaceae bacterium]
MPADDPPGFLNAEWKAYQEEIIAAVGEVKWRSWLLDAIVIDRKEVERGNETVILLELGVHDKWAVHWIATQFRDQIRQATGLVVRGVIDGRAMARQKARLKREGQERAEAAEAAKKRARRSG